MGGWKESVVSVGATVGAGCTQGLVRVERAFGRSICLKRINWNVLYLHPHSVYPIFSSPAKLRPPLLFQQTIHETVTPIPTFFGPKHGGGRGPRKRKILRIALSKEI